MKTIVWLSVLVLAACGVFAEEAEKVSHEMIEVEVRFLEVDQVDLESAGFEWGVAGDDNSGVANFTAVVDAESLNTVLSKFTSPLLNTTSTRAKVITKSGHRATLRTVVEYLYPTSYEKQFAATVSGDKVTQYVAPAVPRDFQMREVGMILDVTPTLSPDGRMINLNIEPAVINEPWWYDYGGTFTNENGKTCTVVMEQPFFAVRSIATDMQIYNGSSVVSGGLITEVTDIKDTRIPVLWRISRIFGEKKEIPRKRNLLIVVTARVVEGYENHEKEIADKCGWAGRWEPPRPRGNTTSGTTPQVGNLSHETEKQVEVEVRFIEMSGEDVAKFGNVKNIINKDDVDVVLDRMARLKNTDLLSAGNRTA